MSFNAPKDPNRLFWDQKYGENKYLYGTGPSEILMELKDELLAHRGRALDIACGEGRNAIYLARLGFQVEAVDISYKGIRNAQAFARSEGVKINFWVADLQSFPLLVNRYDLILNMNFLLRSLIGPIQQALKPGGLLVFQTFTRKDSKYARDRTEHPEYYLCPKELLSFFPAYCIRNYYEGPLKERDVASLVAEKPIDKP